MEPICNVEREVDTVISNFNEFNKHCNDNLTSLITSVELLKENFDESCKFDGRPTVGLDRLQPPVRSGSRCARLPNRLLCLHFCVSK